MKRLRFLIKFQLLPAPHAEQTEESPLCLQIRGTKKSARAKGSAQEGESATTTTKSPKKGVPSSEFKVVLPSGSRGRSTSNKKSAVGEGVDGVCGASTGGSTRCMINRP